MKVYTFHRGKLTDGVVVREDDRLGTVVFLGESGRGRRFEKIGLFRNNPAEVADGRVYDAHPVSA